MLAQMKLAEVCEILGAPAPGVDVALNDLAYDSRSVEPGSLFFCITGRRYDGHAFAQQAVDAGAAALIAERSVEVAVPVVQVSDARAAMTQLASPFFGEPSRQLDLFGVTGTNGKTTVAFLLSAMFEAQGFPTGMVGTVKTVVAGKSEPGIRTTPESADLQRLLRRMVEAGVPRCAMEVTSEGLAEGRIEGCWFALTAFTNLSQDHLNYHGDMESYFQAKRRLFDPDRTDRALVNVDDAAGRRILDEIDIKSHTFAVAGPADFTAADVRMTNTGSRFRVIGPGLEATMSISLPGPFNISNAVCAAAAAHLLGVEPEAISEGAANVKVPGRFESVDGGQPFAVIVDYAHTPDSLSNVLSAARSMTDGSLIAVFGCGGDRDRAKRPLMGRVAGQVADLVYATSDNPRSEDPEAILSEIEQGLAQTAPSRGYRVIEDRREAIKVALEHASPGDVVVIAGKGHETGQEISGVKHPFDDREVALEILESLG